MKNSNKVINLMNKFIYNVRLSANTLKLDISLIIFFFCKKLYFFYKSQLLEFL